MKFAVRQTRTHLMELFAKHGFNPRGDLGQNFLIDINIIESIAQAAEITPLDVVLEVGSGTGGMTSFLTLDAAHVVSVECDSNMFGLASEQTEGIENLTLIHADALKSKNTLNPQVIEEVQKHLAVDPQRRLKLVANLPYSVATPIMSNLMATELPWEMMVCTIQLELADRMVASKDRSNYGALSIWMQSQARLKIVRRLRPEVFWPRPGVDSAVIKVIRDRERATAINDRAFFHDFVRMVFTQRRKLLRPVIAGLYEDKLTKPDVDDVLLAEGLQDSKRAEQLDVPQLVSLSNRVRDAIVRKDEGGRSVL